MSHLVSFVDLVAPIGVKAFFQTYWEKDFLYLHRENACFYDSVLHIDDLDTHLLSQQLLPAFIKVAKSGYHFPLEQWTKVETLVSGDTARVVDTERLFALYYQGASLVLDSTHQTIPKLTDFCIRLEQQLKFRVKTNIYITPPHSQGFLPHYDVHDVMVLQISGSKLWRLYSLIEQALPVEQTATVQKALTAQKADQTIELKAGDLIYLPRGFIHDAVTTESHSVHITLGFHPKYGYQLIEDIVQIAKQDPIFRQALPHGFSSQKVEQEYIEKFKKKFDVLLEGIDSKNLLDKQFDAFVTDQLRFRRGQFNDMMQLPELTLKSVLSKRRSLVYVVSDEEQQVVVRFSGHEINVPHYMKASLQLILQDRPFAITDIQGLITDSGKIDLISQFVRAGFLVIEDI